MSRSIDFFHVIKVTSLVILLAAGAGLGSKGAQAQNVDCPGCVDSGDIANNAVTTKKLKKGAVNGRRLKQNAVKSSKIKDGTVAAADLAVGAVTADKLAAGAVTADKLGSDITAIGLTGVAVVSPGAFHGRIGNDFDDWQISNFGFVTGGADAASGCVMAPVNLPDGVTITELEMLFIDDSTASFNIWLKRVSLVDGSDTLMAQVSTSGIDDGQFRSLSETTIADPVVDAVDFAYFVTMGNCLDDINQLLFGVRIFYS